ncbi:MAG: nucleotidyl transferase AbiEii/AbiGii toxin family protein [Ignavibacteriota bacterium]
MKKDTKNISVSVRNRLLNISNESNRDYNAILRHYFQERFLYRISISQYRTSLVLKGAFLLMTKSISKFRQTKDIDFLGISIPSAVDKVTNIIKEIASIRYNDGVEFEIENIKGTKIKEDADFEGVRFKIPYRMDTIKGNFSIDIGFGDIITNGPFEIEFPVLLDFPVPKILVYSLESAVAEKIEAIVNLNFVTSRMKDFYDLIFIAETKSFDRLTLKKAIIDTFKNRGTNLEDKATVFSDNFKNDPQKQRQWLSFIQLNKLEYKFNFSETVNKIQSFIDPVFDSKIKNNWNPEKWEWE